MSDGLSGSDDGTLLGSSLTDLEPVVNTGKCGGGPPNILEAQCEELQQLSVMIDRCDDLKRLYVDLHLSLNSIWTNLLVQVVCQG